MWGDIARQASLPFAAAQCRGVRPEVSVLSRLKWCLFSSTSTDLPASDHSLCQQILMVKSEA